MGRRHCVATAWYVEIVVSNQVPKLSLSFVDVDSSTTTKIGFVTFTHGVRRGGDVNIIGMAVLTRTIKGGSVPQKSMAESDDLSA